MNKFEVVSEFQPKGDQPNAIKELKEGLDKNISHQTLKGITGSGKSATIAWLIEECQLPSLVLAPNKALAAQLANEFRQFFQKIGSSISFLIMTITNQKHTFLVQIHLLKKMQISMRK